MNLFKKYSKEDVELLSNWNPVSDKNGMLSSPKTLVPGFFAENEKQKDQLEVQEKEMCSLQWNTEQQKKIHVHRINYINIVTNSP